MATAVLHLARNGDISLTGFGIFLSSLVFLLFALNAIIARGRR